MAKIWKTIFEAVHGAERDYTEGPVGQAVILLAIPMVLEMLMESVFAVTDIFWVGRLGPQAIATIGLTESMLTLVYTVAFGVSIGAMSMVARRIGEKDEDGAAITAFQVLMLGVFVSIVIGILGVTFAPNLLKLMGGTPELVAYGTNYMRVMFAGNAAILLLFLGNAVFRGAGDGTIAMRSLWLANGLNVILVPCFVFGWSIFPELGVTGAALATTISRGIGAIYTLTHLFNGIGRIKLKAKHLIVKLDVMWRILRLSASGTFQVLIGTASWIGLVRVVSTFGADAVAGYTIGFRIILFALFPIFGMGNAAATMVGQSLGAKKPERAEKGVWLAAIYSMFFLGGMGLLFFVFAPIIVNLFTSDPTVLAIATKGLRTVSCGFLFYAFGLVITNSFNGAGDTWTPTWINFAIFWVFEIPLAYFLSTILKLGPFGVFLAVTISFSILAVVSALVFRLGRWKTKKV